jgi:MFS family permease
MLGYAAGVAGGVLAAFGVIGDSVWLLLLGMLGLGVGHASNQLARYAAADLYPAERRGSSLSFIVWAGTVGSVAGPSLLRPAADLARALARPDLAGGYLLAAGFMALPVAVYALALRPDPARLAVEVSGPPVEKGGGSLREALRLPTVQTALAGMVAGQVVMVLIMTSTPLHVRHGGHDLAVVGLIMSAHTLGMFAFSPLTGRLVDRLGRFPVMACGLGLLALAAVTAAAAPPTSTALLLLALFVLGLGWNLGFVAGSALLSAGLPLDARARIQGRVDSVTWASSGIASLGSGLLYQATDYRLLSVLGLALLVLPVLVVLRHRRAVLAAAV